MHPLVVAARFAAYVWFTKHPEHDGKTRKEGLQFARANWRRFLPCAHEGIGRLIVRVATSRARRKPHRRIPALCEPYSPSSWARVGLAVLSARITR